MDTGGCTLGNNYVEVLAGSEVITIDIDINAFKREKFIEVLLYIE